MSLTFCVVYVLCDNVTITHVHVTWEISDIEFKN